MKYNRLIATGVLTSLLPLSSFAEKKDIGPIIKPPPSLAQVRSVNSYCTGYNDAAYQWSQYDNNRYWSNQALLWKSMVNQDPSITFSPSFIGSVTGLHRIIIDDYSSTQLNNHEATSGDWFAFADGGFIPKDPVGGWVQLKIEDPKTALIYAAMNIHFWGTPVFSNVSSRNQPNGEVNTTLETHFGGDIAGANVAAIECVTLSAVGGPAHLACGWDNSGDNDDYLAQAEACDVQVEGVKFGVWLEPTLGVGGTSDDGPKSSDLNKSIMSGVGYIPSDDRPFDIYALLHSRAENNYWNQDFWVLVDPPEEAKSSRSRSVNLLLEKSKAMAQPKSK